MTTSHTEKAHSHKQPGTALIELLKEVGPFVLLGLVGAIVLLLLFAKLSEEVFSNEITSLDNNFSIWVHGFANPPLDTFFNALSTLGGTISVTIITLVAFGLLLWRGHPHDAWRLAIAMLGGVAINEALKALFHRTRPELWPGAHIAGFSFPSGHAAMSLCLFGMFAWLGWKYLKDRPARMVWTTLMFLLILLIGLSRIYLGAHFLSDVVAGYLSSGIWLLALLAGSDIFYALSSSSQNT
jgi:undecaprenyl-diphosphatase